MAQTYTDPRALERMAGGLCPECGSKVEAHTGWGGARCSLTDNGVADRIAEYRRGLTQTPVDDHLPVGTCLIIGHPANGVRWFRTVDGWIDQANRKVERDGLNFFDTIGHGAYVIMRGM